MEIIDNIKQEPPQDYILIIPRELPTTQTSLIIKQEQQELKQFTVKVSKFDSKWKRKSKMFKCFSICPKCNLITTQGIKLHYKACGRGNYQCDFCPFSHKDKSEFTKHMKKHFKYFQHTCQDGCGKRFAYKKHLQEHLIYQRKCKFCNVEFVCRNAMLEHQKDFHKEHYFFSKKHHRMTYRAFNCMICDKAFRRPKELSVHLREVHTESKFTCDVCLKMCKSKKILQIHLFTHFGVFCTICGRNVSKTEIKSHLERHYMRHDEQNEFQCDMCDAKYKYKCQLCKHLKKTHRRGSVYVCISNRCKKFQTLRELFDHQKIHVGPAQYKCLACGCLNANSFELKKHIKVTHGQKK